MIQANSIAELTDKLSKSFEKALKVNPSIEVIEFGLYRVAGSKGNFYEVRIGKTADGKYFVACQCLGSLHGNGCVHGAKAFARHQLFRIEIGKQQLAKIESEEPEKVPYLKKTSERKAEKVGRFRI